MIASYNLGEKIIKRKDLLSYMNNMLAVYIIKKRVQWFVDCRK